MYWDYYKLTLYNTFLKYPFSGVKSRYHCFDIMSALSLGCRSGIEVAGLIVDQEIQYRFDSQHTLTTCWPSDCKEVKDIFRNPVAHVGLDSACTRPLAANGKGVQQQV